MRRLLAVANNRVNQTGGQHTLRVTKISCDVLI